MRITLLAIFLVATGSCFAAAQNQSSQCLKNLKTDGRFSSIGEHLALDGQVAAKPQMFTDVARPNDLQRLAIADWIDARSQCVNLSPDPISVNLHMIFLSVVPELYNGQMTFGEFNKKWQLLFKEHSKMPEKVSEQPVK